MRRHHSVLYENARKNQEITRRRRMKARLFAGRTRVACCFCGKLLTIKQATIEHIVPKSRGGEFEFENLTLSCQPCNSRRGDIGYDEFLGEGCQDAPR